jgi:hypothetical protein
MPNKEDCLNMVIAARFLQKAIGIPFIDDDRIIFLGTDREQRYRDFLATENLKTSKLTIVYKC